MPLFQKIKPIEARRFDPLRDYRGAVAVLEWAGARWVTPINQLPNTYAAVLSTLEDGPDAQVPHYIEPGDWVARNPGGEFYAIKPSVMAETYEEVSS
jgi:hypothetical protein